MKKLKLRLDDLLVDTFQTTSAAKEKGTVFGEQCTCYTQCTCPGCPTCAASCNGSCDVSCNGSCAATCDASCYGTCDYSCDCTYDGCGSGGRFSECDYTCRNGVLYMEC